MFQRIGLWPKSGEVSNEHVHDGRDMQPLTPTISQGKQRLDAGRQIIEIAGRQADDGIAFAGEPCIAHGIPHLPLRSLMMLAIHFDDQPDGMDCKIGDVRSDLHLPAHMQSVLSFPLAQLAPKPLLALGHIAA